MVQSLGISVGNQNSYVAAGQGGGIEILLNEYSNRSTPSMVAFTDHSRSIGVDASSNFMMNLKNTVYDLMVLLGKPYKDIINDDSKLTYPFKLEEAADGQALVTVRHLGEERKFTITQVLAMLFTKLRDVAHGAANCVISCPQFFDDNQKDALLNAALIAGLNPLKIISDMSAVVLNYAYYRTTKEDTNKFIAFINFGHSNLQAVLAWLTPHEDTVQILSAESELIGGRDFDKLLAEYFIKEHNLNLSPKAYFKLVASCEKLKKLLSSNTNEIPLHVESLISEDQDFSSRIDRATFEKISQHLLQRVEACLRRTLEVAQANFSTGHSDVTFDLQVVEMVGGSTRIPAFKQLIQNVFNLAPSTTLNTDEAVSRGCVIRCATLHPGMKVKREVQILGSETFYKRGSETCDKELRRVELELITSDRRYRSRIEARNDLEEFIYVERSKFQEGDKYLALLNATLDWLFSEEGEDAPEEDYLTKITELRRENPIARAAAETNGKPEPADASASPQSAEMPPAQQQTDTSTPTQQPNQAPPAQPSVEGGEELPPAEPATVDK